jgi:hypothetical protein
MIPASRQPEQQISPVKFAVPAFAAPAALVRKLLVAQNMTSCAASYRLILPAYGDVRHVLY